MILWIICWTNARGVPDMDAFADMEQAQKCLAFVSENFNNVIMRKIEIRRDEPEEQPVDTESEPIQAENNEK